MGKSPKTIDKARNICMILYPLEDASHASALEYIKGNYQYASITHDRDTLEEGTLKKSHVHVMCRFGQARHISAIAKELGLEDHYIHKCGSLEKYGRYLVHADDPDKAQYTLDQVEGDLRPLVAKALEHEKTEDEKVLALLDLLDSVPQVLTVTQFVKIACANGLYSEVRRNGFMMTKILEEHNTEVKLKS